MRSIGAKDAVDARGVGGLYRRLLVLTLLAAAIALAPAAEAFAADYYYWYALPTSKVFRQTLPGAYAGRALSSAAAPALSLSAARGEYEGRQIVIRPRGPVSGFYLTCSDLVQSTDPSSTPARISASEVSFYWVHYVNIRVASEGLRRRGLFPDALPPMKRADGALLAQNLTAGQNQPFYVLFHVPEGTPKGTYTGTLTLTTRKGKPSVKIPVRLRVFGFSIARQTLRTSFGVSVRCAKYFAAGTGRWPDPNLHPRWESTDFGGDTMNRWMRVMSRYRLSPETLIPGVTTARDSGAIRVRPEYLKDYVGTGKATTFDGERLNFNTLHVPDHLLRTSYVKNPFTSAVARTKAIRFYRTMRDAIGAENMKRAVIYPLDEPKDRRFLNQYAAFIRQVLPGTKILAPVYRTWMDGVQPSNIDIQVYKLHFWFRDYSAWISPARRRGTEFWIYTHTSGITVAPMYYIDRSTTDSRAQGWFVYRTASSGLLYFSVNRWVNSRNKDVWRDPYTNPMSVEHFIGSLHTTGNGEGSLLYPGYYPPLGLSIAGAEPVSSLRMEALRDGIEDYEYLKQLEHERGRAYALRYVAQVISTRKWHSTDTCAKFFPYYSSAPGTFQQTRDQIGSILDSTQ